MRAMAARLYHIRRRLQFPWKLGPSARPSPEAARGSGLRSAGAGPPMPRAGASPFASQRGADGRHLVAIEPGAEGLVERDERPHARIEPAGRLVDEIGLDGELCAVAAARDEHGLQADAS